MRRGCCPTAPVGPPASPTTHYSPAVGRCRHSETAVDRHDTGNLFMVRLRSPPMVLWHRWLGCSGRVKNHQWGRKKKKSSHEFNWDSAAETVKAADDEMECLTPRLPEVIGPIHEIAVPVWSVPRPAVKTVTEPGHWPCQTLSLKVVDYNWHEAITHVAVGPPSPLLVPDQRQRVTPHRAAPLE